MDRTLCEACVCQLEQFVVGQPLTIVGHCVNVRDLGRLAFFTLRSQTWNIQVVCTAESMIDALRTIDEYALVEVTGTVQEKYRRRKEDKIEHELNAKMLTRIGCHPSRAISMADDASGARHIFESIEPIVHGALLMEAARKVLMNWKITELPPPDSLQFVDAQALAGFEHERRSRAGSQRSCPHPPFHAHARSLAAGGLYRFAFFSGSISGCQLLHVVLCRPRSGEMEAVLDDLVAGIFCADVSGRRLNDGKAVVRTESRIGAQLIGSIDQRASVHWTWAAPLVRGDAQAGADAVSTRRDRYLRSGFGFTERVIFYRSGTAIGLGCTLAADFAMAEHAASMLGATVAAVAAWRRIFDTGVVQPIPRMVMMTMVLDDPVGAGNQAGALGPRHDIAVLDRRVDATNCDSLHRECVAQIEQLADVEELRVELEILGGHEQRAKKMTCPMALDAALKAIEPVLPAYRLPLDLVRRLLVICTRIDPEWRLVRPIDLFQMLWTLLGSTSVRSLLERPLCRMGSFGRLIEHRIITDKRQLLYLCPAALPAVDALLNGCLGDERSALIVKLRTLMAQRPTFFATAAQTLATSRARNDKHRRPMSLDVLRCAEFGIATPLLVGLASNAIDDPARLALLQRALSKTGEKVFTNEELQLTDVAAMFIGACPHDIASSLREVGVLTSAELGREILYYLYRPVTMDYEVFCEMLNRLDDRTKDWATWGISGHGEFWNETLHCYEYWVDRGLGRVGKLRLYPSKNAGSFFAKSTAGICTDTNTELFNRRDHYHLNIVDADDGRAAGNVQLYVGDGARGRFLLLRGINPIQGFCMNRGADALVRCILHAACDLAEFGGFSEVRLSEQNGLWNSDSSRVEVRACLKRTTAGMALLPMENPFHLYNYYDRALSVSAYYRIWESSSGQPVSNVSTDGMTR